MEDGRLLESAGRTLAGALARLSVGDFADAAALLRCAARYLEGLAEGDTHTEALRLQHVSRGGRRLRR